VPFRFGLAEFLYLTLRETRGFGNVANDRNWSRTVVIDVFFSFNLGAILDNSISFSAHSSPMISRVPDKVAHRLLRVDPDSMRGGILEH
jgi:hypothetical protein